MLPELIQFAHDQHASDVHISTGLTPMLRIHGDVRAVQSAVLTADDVRTILRSTMRDDEWARYEQDHDIDYTFTPIPGLRCRANAFQSTRGPAAVFRLIASEPKTLEELGIPPSARRILEMDRGLVLVTGPAGSGKSTTLAALIRLLNEERAAHILTIEDPVEFIHQAQKALVNHRELGTSTVSFARALKSALREDPDVIVVGEMRDLETIQLALTAAETGHLVLGTLHTSSAPKTITRIIDVFPPDKQDQIRVMLAESLQMVLSQVLLRRSDVPGRVAAYELMLASTAIKNQIRENQIFQIGSTIEISVALGMQSLDQALTLLIDRGIIVEDQAKRFRSSDAFGGSAD